MQDYLEELLESTVLIDDDLDPDEFLDECAEV